MIHHLTCSKDTYITNKVIAGVRRATDANVGYASTIDLFKLHNESSMKDETGDIQELSRGLLFFDLDQLETDLASLVSTSDSTLKIELVVKDVQGSQVAPSDFSLELYPLRQTFDEGLGSDIIGFSELQAANWVSGSLNTKWNDSDTSGAGSTWDAPGGWWLTTWTGVHASGYIAKQTFAKGDEDLRMDITTYVKAYWNSEVANNGWILKFDSTKESDSKTYFVKRFASRHSKNKFIVPRIEASWASHTIDDRLDFETGKTNELYIRNFSNNAASSFTQNLSSTPLTCKLTFGNFTSTSTTTAVQSIAGISQTGLYKVSVSAIDAEDATLAPHLLASGSVTLQERWTIGSTLVYSGSVDLKKPYASASPQPRNLRIALRNLESSYTRKENPVIRLFVEDRKATHRAVRKSIELKSIKLEKMYYQIKDANNGNIIVPFSDTLSTAAEYTRLSVDEQGPYFSFPASICPYGKTYTIDIAYYDFGKRRVHETNVAFKVV